MGPAFFITAIAVVVQLQEDTVGTSVLLSNVLQLMSTSNPTAVKLCSICKGINIECLTATDGYPYQPSLSALLSSSSDCSLCYLVHTELVDRKSASQSWKIVWMFNELCDRISLTLCVDEARKNLVVRANSPDDEPIPTLPTWPYYRYDGDGILLPLWTRQGDAALRWGLPVRNLLPEQTGSSASIDIARSWIDDCLQNHTDSLVCIHQRSINSSYSLAVPTRLIQADVNLQTIRLVDGSAVGDPYTALSYVWGKCETPWKTVRGNVELRREAFALNDLPQTLKDAVVLTVHLGINYIWIDALCIVQDDVEDWERESVKMEAIYSKASVTLVASCSNSSTSGLFSSHSNALDDFEHRGLVLQCELSNGEPSTLYVSRPLQHPQVLEYSLNSAKEGLEIFERGWTFQEWLLSPRKLYITSSQFLWECGRGFQSEDGLWTHDRPYRSITEAFWTSVKPSWLYPSSTATEEWTTPRSLLWYQDIVSQSYSGRNLTRLSDKLVAISGIAKMFKEPSQYHYLAGIWLESLPGGLCWRPMAAPRQRAEYFAPSWSWASFDSSVEYFDDALDMKSDHSACKIVSAKVYPRSKYDIGSVVNGILTLVAPVLEGEMGTMIQDSGLWEVDDSTPPEDPIFRPDVLAGCDPGRFPNAIQDFTLDVDMPCTGRATAIALYRDQENERWGMMVAQYHAEKMAYERIGFIWTKMPWISTIVHEIPTREVTII